MSSAKPPISVFPLPRNEQRLNRKNLTQEILKYKSTFSSTRLIFTWHNPKTWGMFGDILDEIRSLLSLLLKKCVKTTNFDEMQLCS